MFRSELSGVLSGLNRVGQINLDDAHVFCSREQIRAEVIVALQPERFELEYTAEDGSKARPVMIHRGLLGSMERMTALLIERFEGRMPPWLVPNQVSILPVGDRHRDSADRLRADLEARDVRVAIAPDGSLGRRIREARTHRIRISR